MKKYKVLFFGGGKMGKLAYDVLKEIENVNITNIEEMEGMIFNKNDFDLIFSASYPKRINQDLIKTTSLGGVNLHTGLLPEGRGSHPLNWAIIWSKKYTGITIHKIVDTFDAGDICYQQEVEIKSYDDIISLRERVDGIVPRVIMGFFSNVEKYINEARKQDQSKVSYAPKRRPEDSELNLNAEPEDIDCLFRSCDPVEYPAFVMENGVKRIVKNYSIKNGITYDED